MNNTIDLVKLEYLQNQISSSGYSNRRDWYRNVYLSSEHWKILREAKISQVGRKCEKCGSNKIIQVHHLRYTYNIKKKL